MSDPRVLKAQALHWEITTLRQLGAHRSDLNARRREAACLLEERARELLQRREVLGWTDLFAATTYWGEAGERERASRLLEWAEQHADAFPEFGPRLRHELADLHLWLRDLRVVPSLSAFARHLPPLKRLAA